MEADTEAWEDRPRRRVRDLGVVAVLVVVLVVAAVISQQPETAPTGQLETGEEPTAEEAPPPVAQRPDTGAWAPMAPAPFQPTSPSQGVWTGEELLVWDHSHTGAMFAYLPDLDSWERLAEAPMTPIGGHRMVWTGDEAIVWGGRDDEGLPVAIGHRFSRQAGWQRLPAGPLRARTDAGMTWDAVRERVVIWGGDSVVTSGPDAYYDDGATFDPATDTWEPLPDNGLEGRAAPDVVGLLSGIAVMGGSAGPTTFTDGAMLDGDRVVPIPRPAIYDGPTTFLTTSIGGLLTWGRPLDFGDPSGYTWGPFTGWTPLPRLLNQERARAEVLIREQDGQLPLLIVWGGLERRGVERVTDGFWLNIATGRWRAFPPAPISARADAIVVATADQLLVWGGRSGGTVPTDGASLGLPVPS